MKYKGFIIVIKTGQAREVISTTNVPFSWFPELETMFKHFKIKEMEFEVDVNFRESIFNKDIERKIFKIVRVDKS